MDALVKEGLVRSIGVSNFNYAQMLRIMGCSGDLTPPSTNQVEMTVNFLNKGLVKFCQARGVTITAYSPLGAPGLPG